MRGILSDYLEETISYKTYDFISGYKNLVGGLDSVLNTILTTCGTESLVLAVNSIRCSRREDLRTIFSSGVNNYQNYDHEKLTGDTYIIKRIKDISKSMEEFGAFLLAKTKQITKSRFGSKELMLYQSSQTIMQAV